LSGLVPNLFTGRLSPTLIKTLGVICNASRQAKAMIQTFLFKECDEIIRHHTNAAIDVISPGLGSPSSPLTRRTANNFAIRPASHSLFQRPTDIMSSLSNALTTKSPSSTHVGGGFGVGDHGEPTSDIGLALETLHSFDFYTDHPSGVHKVLKTVREKVINCLDDPDVAIRKGGTVTCCTILDRILKDKAFLSSGRAGRNASSKKNDNDIFYILERLLMVGVADDDEDIRLTVFNSITKALDPFVAKAENLSCVLDAINDESIKVRGMGRTEGNSAYCLSTISNTSLPPSLPRFSPPLRFAPLPCP